MACIKEYNSPVGVKLVQEEFGMIADKLTGETFTVMCFTWTNLHNFSVKVLTYGATIASIMMPDKNGAVEDVIIGYDNMEDYLSYTGATMGRVVGVIKNAKMSIDGVTYKLSSNHGQHHINGGFKGFDKVIWNYYTNGTKLILSYCARDKEEGYPGDVLVNSSFELNEKNEFLVDMKATSSKPTLINLATKSYFNLAGDNRTAPELHKHIVTINADYVIKEDDDLLPTGDFQHVDCCIDLRVPKILGEVMETMPIQKDVSYNYCLIKSKDQDLAFVARVSHSITRRAIEIYSNQPGVQFTTFKNVFSIETQNYPDAINHESFPSPILYPGKQYHHKIIYKFHVDESACETLI